MRFSALPTLFRNPNPKDPLWIRGESRQTYTIIAPTFPHTAPPCPMTPYA